MPLSENRNGGTRLCQNTEMINYATIRIQKWRAMPLSEYKNGGICHCQDTETEEYVTVRIKKNEGICNCQKTEMDNTLLSEYRNGEVCYQGVVRMERKTGLKTDNF